MLAGLPALWQIPADSLSCGEVLSCIREHVFPLGSHLQLLLLRKVLKYQPDAEEDVGTRPEPPGAERDGATVHGFQGWAVPKPVALHAGCPADLPWGPLKRVLGALPAPRCCKELRLWHLQP